MAAQVDAQIRLRGLRKSAARLVRTAAPPVPRPCRPPPGQRRADVDLLGLGPLLDTPVRQLSLGQRMRGDLAAALLHDPEIVYLDEPTIGLDVASKAHVRTFIAELNRERGVTVLLTTHDLSDIERLCSRVVVIDRGTVVQDGTVGDLKRRYGAQRTLVVDLAEPQPALRVDGARTVRVEGARQELAFERDTVSAAAVITAVVAQAPVHDLELGETSIEQIVRRIGAER